MPGATAGRQFLIIGGLQRNQLCLVLGTGQLVGRSMLMSRTERTYSLAGMIMVSLLSMAKPAMAATHGRGDLQSR